MKETKMSKKSTVSNGNKTKKEVMDKKRAQLLGAGLARGAADTILKRRKKIQNILKDL